MDIKTINDDVKDEILIEIMKNAAKIVEPIIFAEDTSKIRDTEDEGCDIKPYAIFLKENDNKIDLRMLFSYYDTDMYDSAHLSHNNKLRKGETIENSLSVFNVNEILNIIYEIPTKYNISIDKKLNIIKGKIIKLIKKEIIKNNNFYEFDETSSFELSELALRTIHSLKFNENKIYVKYNEKDIFGFDAEKNELIESLDFNDIFNIALQLSYDY